MSMPGPTLRSLRAERRTPARGESKPDVPDPLQGDPALVAGFRDGIPAVLERLYRHYMARTRRYLRSMARRMSAPEFAQDSAIADLSQEVFIRAFAPSVRVRFDTSHGLGPYLRVLARHCLIDALRKHRREVLVTPHDLDGAAEVSVEPSHGAPDERVAAVVTSYVADLSAPLRQIYEQRFVLGHSQEQTSRALSSSRRKVRTLEEHLHRGLRRALVHSDPRR